LRLNNASSEQINDFSGRTRHNGKLTQIEDKPR